MKHKDFLDKVMKDQQTLLPTIAADAHAVVDTDGLTAFLNAMVSIAACSCVNAIHNLTANGVPEDAANLAVAMNLSIKMKAALANIEAGNVPITEVAAPEVKADGNLAAMSVHGRG